jgi:hypothetical protein
MTEIWKPINDYENQYEISNFGNVKSLFKNIVLKPSMRGGYKAVGLYKYGKGRTFPIHRLVALNFLENPNCYKIVNHKNGNRLDNNLENLEWTDSKGNSLHAAETGLITIKKIPVLQYSNKNVFIAEYSSVREASLNTGAQESQICFVCRNKGKTAGGFIWKYKNFEHIPTEKPDGLEFDDYPNYIVTRNGKIYSKKSKKFLRLLSSKEGYDYVSFWKSKNYGKRFSVHYLVATTYIDNPDNLPMINHIDGDKTNNNVENLEWCSYSHNMKHYANMKKFMV